MSKLLIYTSISIFITIVGLIGANKYIKKEENKSKLLKVLAILTVVIHYSDLWVNYFKEGSASINATHILPVFPCNVCMWLLVICAFYKGKENLFSRVMFDMTAFAGTICGFIGLAFNENFLANPDLTNIEVSKGLLSHVTMIMGTLYLFVIGKVKMNTKEVMLSSSCCLLLFGVIGLFINGLFAIFNLDSINSMYLIEAPFKEYPFINCFTISLLVLLVMYLICLFYKKLIIRKKLSQE